MQKIKIEQIESILDKYWEANQNGTCKHANILFVAHAGFGRRAAINRWLQKHEEISATIDIYPGKVINAADLGCIGNPVYSYGDRELLFMNSKNSVLVLHNINWAMGHDHKADEVVFNLIKDRHVTTPVGEAFDLSNLCMVIATAFPEDSPNKLIQLPEEVEGMFDRYEISDVIMQETADYVYRKLEKEIEMDRIEMDGEETDNSLNSFTKNCLEREKAQLCIVDRLRKWPEVIKHTEGFSPNRLEMVIEWSENEEDFLKEFKTQIRDKEAYEQIRIIFEKE